MPDELSLFQTTGTTWSERARRGELDAVLTASGNAKKNLYLHTVQSVAASKVVDKLRRGSTVVDFGCGTGRFLRFFSSRGMKVLGTEVTAEMLEELKRIGLPSDCSVALTDGIKIPADDQSVDCIWVCSVLRYSLNVPTPVYDKIVKEMNRVLKSGGIVANYEMYVEQPASDFSAEFERSGFVTEKCVIMNWQFGDIEKRLQAKWRSDRILKLGASLMGRYRYHFGASNTSRAGLRDYFFEWRKLR